MSDQPVNSIIDLQVLPENSQIPIVITTDVYIRLQQLLLEGLLWKDLEHLQLVLKAVHDKTDSKDPIQYFTETILHLLSLTEESAKSAKLIEKRQFDTALGKLVPEKS